MKNEMIGKENLYLSNEVENFIDYLDVSKGTLQTYKESLKVFFEYLVANNIKRPTRNDLRGYRETLKQSLSIYTINSYLTAIRRFFGYLEINDIYEDITKDIKNIKTSNIPKKQVLTLEQTKNIYNSLTNNREKALFGLMCSTGMRTIEVSRALIEDIKIHNGEFVLFFRGKMRDDKSEYVKLSGQTLQDILNYIGDRKEGNIFISTSNNNKGNGVTTKTLRLEIKNIFKRFNLDYDTFSCHSLRRTFATIAYNSGADIYEIKEVLRHRSVSTTTRYIAQITRDNNKTECNVSNLIFGVCNE